MRDYETSPPHRLVLACGELGWFAPGPPPTWWPPGECFWLTAPELAAIRSDLVRWRNAESTHCYDFVRDFSGHPIARLKPLDQWAPPVPHA